MVHPNFNLKVIDNVLVIHLVLEGTLRLYAIDVLTAPG
jgi:hypothetical protein